VQVREDAEGNRCGRIRELQDLCRHPMRIEKDPRTQEHALQAEGPQIVEKEIGIRRVMGDRSWAMGKAGKVSLVY